ncbi:CIA30 family protein [Halpernia sp. GG3]
MEAKTIYNFNKNSNIEDWTVVDDIVMGGQSAGNYYLNSEGFGVFEGNISLANNGGFSSVRHNLNVAGVKSFNKIILTLKGDAKDYQFRIKSNVKERHSYISSFHTSGELQKIEISLEDMYPVFRGQKLDLPNFSDDSIQEITFLIGNKRE